MKLKEIYRLAVQKGKENDPRGTGRILQLLQAEKDFFESLSEVDKVEYDQERMFSPYHDTRVLNGDPEREVNKVLAGIDIEAEEILLADNLRSKGKGIDLVIAHHPEGKALANLHLVMHAQEDLLKKHGVPVNVARGVMKSRIEEVQRGLMPANHNRAVDTAVLLDIPFMCVHSAADNLVVTYIQKIMDDKKPGSLEDILAILKEIPEYGEASVNTAVVPTIMAGTKKSRPGKIVVMMAGGTSGSERIFEKLSLAGVGTVIVMHIPEKNRKEAKKHHVHVIVAGHMASDSLGMNLFLDELEKRGLEIFTCSGLMRHSRAEWMASASEQPF